MIRDRLILDVVPWTQNTGRKLNANWTFRTFSKYLLYVVCTIYVLCTKGGTSCWLNCLICVFQCWICKHRKHQTQVASWTHIEHFELFLSIFCTLFVQFMSCVQRGGKCCWVNCLICVFQYCICKHSRKHQPKVVCYLSNIIRAFIHRYRYKFRDLRV